MNYLPDEVGQLFSLEGCPTSTVPHGNGNVNDTFLLSREKGGAVTRYTVQRINHEVFKDPEGLMENFARVTEHLGQKLSVETTPRRSLRLIRSQDGRPFVQDSCGNYWRMMEYIDGGESAEIPESPRQAYQAAKAFGEFQAQLADLPGPPLLQTIPDFHNTRKRFNDFRRVVTEDPVGRTNEVRDLITFAIARESLADAIKEENFPVRIVHNDTKLNNILLDKKTGEGICVVDLDTVMPGCTLHDFGDLVRTAACSAQEDEPDINRIQFLPEIFEALVESYLDATNCFLSPLEVDHLAIAPQVLTYELALRFLADYLEGDIYFKVKRPGHNLQRARAQLRLLASMEEHASEMESIVEKFASTAK